MCFPTSVHFHVPCFTSRLVVFLKKKKSDDYDDSKGNSYSGCKKKKKNIPKTKKKNHVYVRICMYKKKTGEFFSFLPQLREEEEVTWSKLKREKKKKDL